MPQNELKRIVVNSPPGSGNVFCQHLIQQNLVAEIKWVNHDILGFEREADSINIFILRSPYEVVASGIEIRFNDASEDHQSGFSDDVDFRIKDKIILHLGNYHRFINMARHYDSVTPVSFELLTKDPDGFLEYISKKFDIPFKKDRRSAEQIKEDIKGVKDVSTRVPREKSDFRKKIDLAVKKYEPLKHAYGEYILLRDEIQKDEMLGK